MAVRDIINPEAQYCVADCGGMESPRHLFIYCSLFGRRFSRGSPCRRRILKLCQIIFYSLLIHQVVYEHGPPFYNLFDTYVFRLFGTREITGYLEIRKCPCINCWTRSNFILTGG
jgi:hypothetical protein